MSTNVGCCCMRGMEALEDIRDALVGGEAMGTIVCHDWDGTVIGAIPVSRRATAGEVERLLAEFAMRNTAAEVDEYGYAEDAAKPLSNKAGYRFRGIWLWEAAEAFACYMSDAIAYVISPANHGLLTEYTAEQLPTKEEIRKALATEGVVRLQAAYEAQGSLNRGGSKHVYTQTSVPSRISSSITAETGVYNLSITIKRHNMEGNPVERLRKPLLKVEIKPAIDGAGIHHSMIPVNNEDVATADVMVDKQISYVSVTLIDGETGGDLLLANNASAALTVHRWADERGSDGFVKDGTVNFIFEQAVKAVKGMIAALQWNLTITATSLEDAGITYTNTTLVGVREAIFAAVKARLEAGNTEAMTAEEMQAAIDAVAPAKIEE